MFWLKEKVDLDEICSGSVIHIDLSEAHRKFYCKCPDCSKTVKASFHKISNKLVLSEDGGAAYCRDCSQKKRAAGEKQRESTPPYRVAWRTSDGVRHEWSCDDPDDARKEADALRKRYHDVEIYPRFVGESQGDVVEMLALVAEAMQNANCPQEEIDGWIETVSAQYGMPAPGQDELIRALAAIDQRVDAAAEALDADR